MRNKAILIIVLLLSFFLRIYKVSEFPAGLNADEAAIGYNAYSLIKTGKDEFGHPWPINFQSFNDYKPGLYFYLVIPSVWVFGLNELAIRLPSVIFGTLTVLLVFLLVKKMSDNTAWAMLSSLLVAISPWCIFFSRGGWESNATVFFIVLGVYLFFVSLRKPKIFPICALSFVLSMYTYHSARMISPLLILGLALCYLKDVFQKKNVKWLILSVGIGIILILPLILSLKSPEGTSRFSGVGIFADQGPFWRTNELRGQHKDPYSLLPKIIHNKYFEYSWRFFDNYLRHFGGDFLFISGDEIQRHRVPEAGQMYLTEIPFLILGLYFLIKKRVKGRYLLLWWLVITPLASALTFQSPHATRALNMAVPLVIICAYGIVNFWDWCKQKNRLFVILLSCYLVIGYIWNISFFLHQYFVHYPQKYPSAWEYGFKDLVEYLSTIDDKYKQVFVTNRYDQPYILFAFYLQYPPERFQKEAFLAPRDQYGFSTVDRFNNYIFGKIDLNQIPKGGNLVIGTPEEIPDSATILKKIYFKDGKTEAFRIIEQ